MDFAPMNMRMVAPQAADVGQMQHNMNQQAALQHDMKTLEQKQLIERQQSQVRTKDDAEGEKIKENPERQKNGGKERGPRKRKSPKEIMEALEGAEENQEPPMAVDQYRGHRIDISC